jgi:hypothetical protein
MNKHRRKPPRIWWEFDGQHWVGNAEMTSKFSLTFAGKNPPDAKIVKTWESIFRKLGRAIDNRVEPIMTELGKAIEEQCGEQLELRAIDKTTSKTEGGGR